MPSLLVVAFCVTFVSILAAVTATPPMTARVGSKTVPVISPRLVCANKDVGLKDSESTVSPKTRFRETYAKCEDDNGKPPERPGTNDRSECVSEQRCLPVILL